MGRYFWNSSMLPVWALVFFLQEHYSFRSVFVINSLISVSVIVFARRKKATCLQSVTCVILQPRFSKVNKEDQGSQKVLRFPYLVSSRYPPQFLNNQSDRSSMVK